MTYRNRNWVTAGVLLATTLLLTACGGGGGGSTTGSGKTGGDDVAATLQNLSVDTTPTPRVDENNDPLPDNFTPLGMKKTLQKKDEMFIAGLGLTSADDDVNVLKFLPGVSNVSGVPSTPDSTEKLNTTPMDTSWKSSPYNDAVAGDVDGDGLDEVVEVWWDPSNSAINLRVIDDSTEGFAESTTSVLNTGDVSWLKVVTGDFDGDGIDDIAVGIVEDSAGKATLSFLKGNKNGGYSIDSTREKVFDASNSPSQLGIQMVSGQLDLDAGEELAVLINETWGSGRNSSPGTGTSNYYVYDDAGTGFTELTKGRVSGDVGTATHNAVTGAIAMGDVDGDGRDEIVLAGMADGFSYECDAIAMIQFVLDDATTGFTNLGVNYNTDQNPFSSGGCETSGNNGYTLHVWASTLDIDGDQYAEIQVNGLVYEDFHNAAAPWDRLMVETDPGTTAPAQVPFAYIFKQGGGNNARARTTRANTTMVVGDVTADGKDDIIVYSPGQVDIGDISNGTITYNKTGWAVTVWGIDPLTGRWGKQNITGREGNIGMLYYEEVTGTGTSAVGAPLIVPANVDNDSTMLKFSEGSHQVVFSEPLVHAALAAPPCYNDGSQVTDDCRTSWGTGNTTGVNASISHQVSVTEHTGINGDVSIPLVGKVGVEVEESAGVSLKAEASYGYQLTKTVTYTTGPMEDTVVATVIPYDQYTYKILSHPVFPDLVGKDMVISLPRSPRTMQIDRQFYNDSLVGDGVKIDSSVFSHSIGVPSSYPTRSQMLAKTGALSIGPKDIGASLGNQSVSISESKVASFTATMGVNYETTVKATGGKVMRGFTVSSTTEASLGFSVGSEVTFTGTVGDMPPATFSLDKAYSFGMYVYKQDPGDIQRPFQVINYWVE